MSDDWKSKVVYFSSKDADDPEKVKAYRDYIAKVQPIPEMTPEEKEKFEKHILEQRINFALWASNIQLDK